MTLFLIQKLCQMPYLNPLESKYEKFTFDLNLATWDHDLSFGLIVIQSTPIALDPSESFLDPIEVVLALDTYQITQELPLPVEDTWGPLGQPESTLNPTPALDQCIDLDLPTTQPLDLCIIPVSKPIELDQPSP